MNRKEFIGREVKKSRTKRRLSQKRVAELSGLEKYIISDIERGKANVSIDVIDKLCNVVGANIRLIDGNKIFEDLVFEKHPFHILADQMGESYPNYNSNKTCYQSQMTFGNGLQISVIIGTPFYSNGIDTYEVCLWSESGYEEVFGNLSDMETSYLMEYAQIIGDIRILDCLKENGFELHYGLKGSFSYRKQYKGWYINVNPCGKPIISASKSDCNFGYLIDYSSFKEIEGTIKDLDVYIRYCESHV